MEVEDFTVVVPFAANDDPYREAALDFVVEWLRPHGWPIVVEPGDPDPWSKGATIARAMRRVSTPGLVLHDADVLVEHSAVTSCASAVVAGYAWAQPHDEVFRLSRRTTQLVLARQMRGPHPFLGIAALDRPRHLAARGGGIVVLSRDAYDLVGGIDPRFVGWGGEDISFARALDTLAGPSFRLRVPMWHLYHEPQTILPGRRASPESERLASQYLDAVGSEEQMRSVIER